jgi:hypothetical protein
MTEGSCLVEQVRRLGLIATRMDADLGSGVLRQGPLYYVRRTDLCLVTALAAVDPIRVAPDPAAQERGPLRVGGEGRAEVEWDSFWELWLTATPRGSEPCKVGEIRPADTPPGRVD